MSSSRFQLSGFTLIELMIYMTLLGLISIGVFSAYNFFVQSSIEARSIAELQLEKVTSTTDVRAKLANADSVSIVTNSDQECAITSNLESVNRTGLEFTTSQKLTVSGYKGPGGNTSRSISFWMVQTDQTSARSIIGIGRETTDEKFLVYTDSTNGVISIDSLGKQLKGSTDVVDGNWHHVMVIYDSTISDNMSPTTVSIYIDGQPETITSSNNNTANLDTDNATNNVTIGGYLTENSFTGQLASVKIWHRALSRSEVWPEVLSVNAFNRQDLALELKLEDAFTDTSVDAYTVTGFASPKYTTLVNSYARKSSYGFNENADDDTLYDLWRLDYIDTSSDQSVNRCTTAGTTNGWTKEGESTWLKTGDNFFTLTDNVLSINAEVAKNIVGSTVSVGNSGLILTGTGVDKAELCKIAPNIVGFDTGGSDIAEAVVRIDDDSLESNDDLYFFDATKSGPITETVNGVTKTYYYYKNIKSNGTVIWPNITAEYESSNGIMKICTSTANNCNSPTMTLRTLENWEKVFREITYSTSAQTYKTEKGFLFSLGGAIPCRIDNYIACKNINNNDNDDNLTTCYHWFDFIDYDDLGASYSCHAETGTGDATRTQCLADWEDARDDAASSARELFGLEGYLATLTTEEEDTCAIERIAGAFGWLGGSDRHCERDKSCGDPTSNTEVAAGPYGKYNSKSTTGESYWYWVTGPEGEWSSSDTGYADHDGGAGQSLYFGQDPGSGFNVYDPPSANGYDIPPSFTKWASGEPNDWVNSGGDFPKEDYVHTWHSGNWNDYTSYYTVDGFVIEYGGISTDARRVLTKRSTINTFEFLKNCQ